MMIFPEIVRVNILGVGVDAINMDTALQSIKSLIIDKEQGYISVVPAHTIMDCQRDDHLRRIVNNSSLVTPDGMSMVFLLRLKGKYQVGRVYGPDLLLEACRSSLSAGWRHFFYGGDDGVAETLVAALIARWHVLQVAGTYTPPFRPLTLEEDEEIIKTINDAEADILWVGLSSPKQEHWMAEHLGKINAPVMIGVGAAFDFLSGRKPQAPRWIQRSGLEWLFRLMSEPRRLWPRYRQYPKFVLLVLLQILGLKEFPSE